MYYNVGMESGFMTSILELKRFAARAARNLDPRTVRLRDPRPRVRFWTAIAVVGAALVAGAAAMAATGRGSPEGASATGDADRPASSPEPERAPSARAARPAADTPPPAAAHPNFHDPIYIFTEGAVADVSAYPMADPPGVVVNLEGAPEPDAPAESMVGEDPRIRAIRRRVTANGLRYVVGLTIPVRRIEVLHEGNVVIVTPIR